MYYADNMVHKRPFDNGEVFDISSKHPRQAEQSNRLVSFSEFVFPDDVLRNHRTSEDVLAKDHTKSDEKLPSEVFDKCSRSTGNDEINLPGCICGSSLVSSSTNREESGSDTPFHIPLYSEGFNPEHQIRMLAHCEEIYSLLLDLPPQKHIPIGPDHQAGIPPWVSVSDFDLTDENQIRVMGKCVIPMPEIEKSANDPENIGNGRGECSCEDLGSVRCVRKHIEEAREELSRTIGPERFEELVFSDMGEQVAQKWSEEEERLFHETIFSNPASSGKNFWVNLSIEFPSRTRKEIVSYYFNVFMLRKRAEQNRCDSISIDSDCDEYEFQVTEEDEDDSSLESPLPKILDNDNDNGINQASDKLQGQDDSCTSSDTGPVSQRSGEKPVNGEHYLLSSFNGLSNNGHEYILEPCDGAAKAWNNGNYLTCFGNKVDFLPTCSMIEEVFGDGSCEYKPRDGKNLS